MNAITAPCLMLGYLFGGSTGNPRRGTRVAGGFQWRKRMSFIPLGELLTQSGDSSANALNNWGGQLEVNLSKQISNGLRFSTTFLSSASTPLIGPSSDLRSLLSL